MPINAGIHTATDHVSDLLETHDESKRDKSSLISRNVTVGVHRTSVRLEPDMWNGLREICRREHVSMHDIATAVSTRKSLNTSLAAAIRVFVMAYFRAASTEEGHNRAGHGPGGSFMQALVRGRLEDQDNNMTLPSRDRNVLHRVVGAR